jgi:hypothetical protein
VLKNSSLLYGNRGFTLWATQSVTKPYSDPGIFVLRVQNLFTLHQFQQPSFVYAPAHKSGVIESRGYGRWGYSVGYLKEMNVRTAMSDT